MTKMIIVAAISENNIIGKNGSIPWHSREEISHFKNITIGYPVLMGRKTFFSLRKPLIDRTNIVLTKNTKFKVSDNNVYVFRKVKDVYDFFVRKNFTKLFIIGGGEIYSEFINKVDELLISRMKFNIDGDTYFPEIKKEIWKLNKTEKFNEFVFEQYIRK